MTPRPASPLASPLARLALPVILLAVSFGQEGVTESPPRGLGAGSATGQAADSAASARFIEATWASCAACHAAPDARVPHDARWIGLNRTTACLTGKAATPVNRARLMAYLEGGSAPKPALVRQTDPLNPRTHGPIAVPASPGSAYLRRIDAKAKANETLRLYWDASKNGRELAVPHGQYELIGYSFYREQKGVTWTASATVQEGEKPDAITVGAAGAAGAAPVASLPVTSTIYHDLTATADGPQLSISFQLRSDAGDRMTLTRGAALVDPTWTASADDGTELASGQFALT